MKFSGLLNALTRVTSSGNYISEIDGLRFLAIAPVVIHHLFERVFRHIQSSGSLMSEIEINAYHLLPSGRLGVELFFIISGMVISMPILKGYLFNDEMNYKFNFRKYLIRRLTRLEPPYILVMIISLLGVLALSSVGTEFVTEGTRSFDSEVPLLESFLSSLVYMHGLLYNTFPRLNPPAWSLEIEFQFYLVAPFIILFILRLIRTYNKKVNALIFSLIIFVISIKIIVYLLVTENFAKFLVTEYIQFFTAGFVMSIGFLSGKFSGGFFRKYADYFFVFGMLLAIVSDSFRKEFDGFYYLLDNLFILIGLIFLFIGVLSGGIGRKFCSIKIVSVIGGMCYSIYLIHLIFLQVGVKVLAKVFSIEHLLADGIVVCLILIPLLLLISSIFFFFIEKPCMNPNWFDKLKIKTLEGERK